MNGFLHSIYKSFPKHMARAWQWLQKQLSFINRKKNLKLLLTWLEVFRKLCINLAITLKNWLYRQWLIFLGYLSLFTNNTTWVDFAKDFWYRFQNLHPPLFMLASSLAYYAAFSLGPLILLITGGLGFFLRNRPDLTAEYKNVIINLVNQLLPLREYNEELASLGFDTFMNILQQGALINGIISLVFLLWVSSNFFNFLQLALEIIFDVPQQRGFWRKRLVSLFLVFSVGIVIVFEVVFGFVLTSVGNVFTQFELFVTGQGILFPLPTFNWGLLLISNTGRFVLATLAFMLCFRYLPRSSSTWLGALIGSLFCTTALIVSRQLLFLFFNIDRFNLIYGLVTRLLAILLWLYTSLVLILISALISAQVSYTLRTKLPALNSSS